MVRFRPRSLPSFLVFSAVLLILLVGVGNVVSDEQAYDDKEAIRRAAKRLDEFDKAQKEAARRRYDDRHSSSSDESGLGCLICIGLIILMVVGALSSQQKSEAKRAELIRQSKYKREKALAARKAREARETRDKALFAERLERATSLGFSVDDETKECPACAETIKFKAKICRYCRKEFSDEEIEKATRSKVDAFLSDHKSA